MKKDATSFQLRVQTIYPAFQGEVNLAGIGAQCVFVRLSGCNLRCYKETLGGLCDTPEALSVECGNLMSVQDIVTEVKKYPGKVVCLTGGEPLMQSGVDVLIDHLMLTHHVSVETNGTYNIGAIRNLYRENYNLSFVLDYKLKSTGESRFHPENFNHLCCADHVKFVLYNLLDYTQMKEVIQKFPQGTHFSVGLFWGTPELTYEELNRRIYEDGLVIDMNYQVHKMSVLYDKADKSKFNDLVIPREL